MKRLSREDLFKCSIDNLSRLAAFLGVLPNRKNGETDRAYRARIILKIERWEKEESLKPKSE